MWWRRLAVPLFLAYLTASVGVFGQMLNRAYQNDAVMDRPREDVPAVPAYRRLPTPDDLLALAWLDARELPPGAGPYVRYLAVQDELQPSMRSTSYALGLVGRGSTIQRPIPIAGGMLLRIDLRFWFPQEKDLQDVLKLWEQLAYDPMFSLLITKDTLKQLGKERAAALPARPDAVYREEVRSIDWPGGVYTYPDDSGRPPKYAPAGHYDVKLKFRVKGVDVVRIDPAHLDPVVLNSLRFILQTEAPVVDHRYFKLRALTAIQDAGVFKTVFGGFYYEITGIDTAEKRGEKNATDLDVFLEDLGIGNIRAGLTARRLFDRLRSDERVALLRSDITGKGRVVEEFTTPAVRPTEGGGWGAITGDIFDEDVDIGDSPIANLLDPRIKAREAIFPKRSGFPRCALFNGQGGLVREVPPNVAASRNHPTPHTTRLQPILDCLDCHCTDGSDWWKPLRNDAKDLFDFKLDLAGDLAARSRATDPDTLDRLFGLYSGDFRKPRRRACDDQAEIALRSVGPWPGENTVRIVETVAKRLVNEHRRYWYDMVDARQALAEVGYVAPQKDAVKVLNRLLPPDARSAVPGFIPEDVMIAALKAGKKIGRTDFALRFAFVAERVQHSVQLNLKAGRSWHGGEP